MKKYLGAILIAFFLNIVLFQTSNAADTSIVTVNATVVSKNNCKFNSASSALNFGTLDPANPVVK